MSPADPQSAFVDNYIKLMTDSETSDFQKILDMKVSLGSITEKKISIH